MTSSSTSPLNPSPLLSTPFWPTASLKLNHGCKPTSHKLNCDKSVMIIICPNCLTKTTHNFCLIIDNSTLSPSPQIRNLGVISDSNLSFEHNVNQITGTAFFHLKNISCLHLSLSENFDPCLHHIQNWLLPQNSLWYIIQSPKTPVYPELCCSPAHPLPLLWPHHPCPLEPPLAPCPTTDPIQSLFPPS